VSDPYQPQDPYANNPYGPQPTPPPTPPPVYGYPQQDPYAQQPQQPPQGYGYPPQPGYPQQPGYGGYGYGGPTGQNNGIAVASLVVGIISIVGSCFFGGLIGIVAVGLGIAGLNKSKATGTGRGQSIAGIATGAVGLLISIVFIIILIAGNSLDSTYYFNSTY
jgi:hypothetical protein